MVAGIQSANRHLQVNNINPDLLWAVINFLWSMVLILASIWLLSISRYVESDRQKYRSFIRRHEEKQRNERKL
jgi:hypothetical protein